MSTKVSSETINETARVAKERAPEFASAARRRAHKKADGGIHTVKHVAHKSHVEEAIQGTEVARGPIKRWVRASALATLPPPPGFHIEWVRRDNRNRGDLENLVAHLSEGWEFCRKSDFPAKYVPTQRLSDYGECIGNDSSLLMKLPLELKQQRDEYYRNNRNRSTKAVGMPDPAPEGVSHPDMPIVEDKNRVRVRMRPMKGRRVPTRVADDV
jgi:hypothetical protein